MITATIIAMTAIVEYWRLTKASAPSLIAPATSCIPVDPLSAFFIWMAKYAATTNAIILQTTTPTIRIIPPTGIQIPNLIIGVHSGF